MPTDESLIRQVIKLYEEKTGWGDSAQWSNQDFLELSERIREQTGITLSHVTLKRIWGKVKYESLPNTHTLNTLVQFLGYDNWRDFSVRHSGNEPPHLNPTEPAHLNLTEPPHLNPTDPPFPNPTDPAHPNPSHPTSSGIVPPNPSNPSHPSPSDTFTATTSQREVREARENRMRKVAWFSIPLALILLILLYLHGQQPSPQAQDYSFSSKKVVSSGVPNSVIFDYDATRALEDSVVIQQSWDTTRRVKVPKYAHQYTSIYYYPDFYHATLQVGNKVVKSHNLLIESDGWLPMVAQDPIPVYFKKDEAMAGGKMRLTIDQIKQKNILLQPSPPTTMFYNVRDFGGIYSDHFDFETSLKNDYSEGSAACQLSRIYLLCEGTAIWVPLTAKGCVSTVARFFTYYFTSGRREDLSNFGVDFDKYVKLRIESDSGRAKILIDGKLAYTVPRHIIRSKIIGIMYAFQGTGSVDYVSLSNGKVSYRDDF